MSLLVEAAGHPETAFLRKLLTLSPRRSAADFTAGRGAVDATVEKSAFVQGPRYSIKSQTTLSLMFKKKRK